MSILLCLFAFFYLCVAECRRVFVLQVFFAFFRVTPVRIYILLWFMKRLMFWLGLLPLAVHTSAHTYSTDSIGGHIYVDLGLPSGTLWAICNIGAEHPEDFGNYYAWGETTPKDTCNWSNYVFTEGGSTNLTKYCTEDFYGKTDGLTTLLPQDDAATANWGVQWRMPTFKEQQELINGCFWSWTDNYAGTGVSGRMGTSISNGQVIFFPAAGYKGAGRFYSVGDFGEYWSSNLDASSSDSALDFSFVSGNINSYGNSRYNGQTVRAVVRK